jgi:hypothetical protein
MRRPSLILLVAALVLPTAAIAARQAPGDGSLIVKGATGKVIVQGRGLIYGYFDRGSLTVVDYEPDGLAVPSVSGARMTPARGKKANVVYTGSDVRFLFPGGEYTLRFEGTGIDLSGVGVGQVQALGLGMAQAVGLGTAVVAPRGTIAVNGTRPIVLGVEPVVLTYGSRFPVTGVASKLGKP